MAGCVSLSWMAQCLAQRAHVLVLADMAEQQVLQRGGGEEILLPQAQLLAGGRLVAGIEDLRDAVGARAGREGADMVAAVERFQHQRVGGTRRPQAQRVDELTAPAEHGGVVSDRDHGFHGMPGGLGQPVPGAGAIDRAAEADQVADVGPGEFPRIAEGEPGFGIFLLPPVADDLAEHAVVIADAVAVGGDRQRRHAVHVAGGEPAEAAIAQGGVRLHLAQAVEIDVQLGERGTHLIDEVEIAQRVVEQAADEEFQREIVNALAALCVGGTGGGDPALDDAVAHGERGGDEPVALGGDDRVAADGVGQLGNDGAAQGGDVLILSRQCEA